MWLAQSLPTPVIIENGTITAQGHGLGMMWDETAVKKYAV